jgi:hypothetical protein
MQMVPESSHGVDNIDNDKRSNQPNGAHITSHCMGDPIRFFFESYKRWGSGVGGVLGLKKKKRGHKRGAVEEVDRRRPAATP